MPIVSISKIQHRYGLSENLPQLSAAELGWSIDSRKLYIGNGPISEGAPTVGNTEILTEYSDILAVSDSYIYKGEAAGYTHQTGVDASNPTSRTLQRKLDEFVSVKDFGATGDGVTDDTAAINRAFFQLFSRESNNQVRRSLFFPAGVYIVSDTIKIPAYAKVYGEGKNSSIVRQTTATVGFAFADSLQQIGANIGTGGATIPSFIEVNDISFEHTDTGNILNIASSQNCIVRRVAFKGPQSSAPDTVGPSCVELSSTAINQTKNLVFEQCDFTNNNFGIVADDDMQGILFNGCSFNTLYEGAKLGESVTGTGSSVDGPKALRITNGYFDNIYDTGIHVYTIGGIVSAYNYFADVGNSTLGVGNPSADVIIFGADGNASIGDIFDRPDADTDAYKRINSGGYESYTLEVTDGVQYGLHRTEAGKSISLADNTAVATSSGIEFDSADQKTNLIYYTAARGSNIRHGTLRITASNSGSTLTDEFNDDGTDIGLEFSVSVAAGTATLNYTTTSTTNDITFKYRIERLT